MSTAKLIFGLLGSVCFIIVGIVLLKPAAILLGMVMAGACIATMLWLKKDGMFP